MGDRLVRKGLVLGITVLFIGSNVVSGFNIQIKNKTNSLGSSRGNILYVGGSGLGNYTKIQNAIDNANNGDTIFVYNGIYYENVRIMQKSINLIGEDKNLTIIDANYSEYPILIVSSNYARVSRFTLINPEGDPNDDWESVLIKLRNCQNTVIDNNIIIQNNLDYGDYCAGIYLLESDNNIINNNVIFSKRADVRTVGIRIHDGCNLNNVSNNEIYNYSHGVSIYSYYNHDATDNTLYGNYIYHNRWGVEIIGGNNTKIINNIITLNRWDGLDIRSDNCFISGNIISNNGAGGEFDNGFELRSNNNYIINNELSNNDPIGITIWDNTNNYLINNNITINKQIGLYVFFLQESYVSYNNFIDNGNYNACFENYIENSFSVKWNKNYWSDNQGSSYHKIPGRVYIIFIFGIPWNNFDWNPANEPYDINETKNYDIDDYSRNVDNRLFG